MESIKWQTGPKGQLEFATETAKLGLAKVRDEQVDRAGLDGISAEANRSDSWVDATVTLLATIVFGLGWAVVELQGADPVQAGYDQAVQTPHTRRTSLAAWSSSAIDSSMLADAVANDSTRSVEVGFRAGEMWGAERERWIDVVPQSSKQ